MIASLLLSCCSFSFVFGCGLFFGGFKCLPVNGCSIVVILVLSHLPSGPILNLQNPLVYLGSFICGEMYSDSSNIHIGCPIIICVKDRLKLKKAILVCTMLPEWSQCCSVMSDSLWPHCSLLGLSVYGILQASILEWVAVPHCRWILYHLGHQGSHKNTGVGSLYLLQGIFLTQESNQGLLNCRQILYQLSYQGSPTMLITLRLFISSYIQDNKKINLNGWYLKILVSRRI